MFQFSSLSFTGFGCGTIFFKQYEMLTSNNRGVNCFYDSSVPSWSSNALSHPDHIYLVASSLGRVFAPLSAALLGAQLIAVGRMRTLMVLRLRLEDGLDQCAFVAY